MITFWHLRILHDLSRVQALYEQETAIPRVRALPGLGVVSQPRLRWRQCSRRRSIVVPSLGSQELEPHGLGACLHHSMQLGHSRNWRNERLRVAPAVHVAAPAREHSATGAPSVRRVACPVCIAVRRQHPLLVLELVLVHQPRTTKNRPIRFSVDQSRTVGLDIDLQHALAPNGKSILSVGQEVRSSAQGLTLLELLVIQQLFTLVVHV